jgi:hypothetical protein
LFYDCGPPSLSTWKSGREAPFLGSELCGARMRGRKAPLSIGSAPERIGGQHGDQRGQMQHQMSVSGKCSPAFACCSHRASVHRTACYHRNSNFKGPHLGARSPQIASPFPRLPPALSKG